MLGAELLVVDVDEVTVVVVSGVSAGWGRGLTKMEGAGALGVELVVVDIDGVIVVGVGIVVAVGDTGGLMMLSRSDSSLISWILLFSSFLM